MARRTTESGSQRINSIIGPETVFEGNFKTKDTTRIEGTIIGDITSEGTLILGEKSQITGNIVAKNIIVGGTVEGNITVEGKVELTSSGSVKGDIATKSLVIDEHAVFQGNCLMNTELLKEV